MRSLMWSQAWASGGHWPVLTLILLLLLSTYNVPATGLARKGSSVQSLHPTCLPRRGSILTLLSSGGVLPGMTPMTPLPPPTKPICFLC